MKNYKKIKKVKVTVSLMFQWGLSLTLNNRQKERFGVGGQRNSPRHLEMLIHAEQMRAASWLCLSTYGGGMRNSESNVWVNPTSCSMTISYRFHLAALSALAQKHYSTSTHACGCSSRAAPPLAQTHAVSNQHTVCTTKNLPTSASHPGRYARQERCKQRAHSRLAVTLYITRYRCFAATK